MTVAIALPEILTDCLSRDDHFRYAMERPWFHDGYIYAAHTRRAARMKADADPFNYQAGAYNFPNACGLFDKWRGDESPTQLPEPKPEWADQPCKCKGKPIGCDTCSTTGRCSCSHCEAEHDCGACNGSGDVECDECENGLIKCVDKIPVGRNLLAAHYILWLWTRGVREVYCGQAEVDPYRFVHGDVEGLVMPMRRKE